MFFLGKAKGQAIRMMKQELDARLFAVAAEVRDGAYLADVGTDHAYLPIYLAEAGRIANAIASDIRSGPLAIAEKNIRAAGLSEVIEVKLADGLCGMEAYPVTDIVIAGMGGQMIASILEAAPFVKETRPRLILQPMQNIPELRTYLSGGYRIEKETQVLLGDKFYQILTAVYDGVSRPISEVERILGQYNILHKAENEALFSELCRRQLLILDEKIGGLRRGGYDTKEQVALRDAILAEWDAGKRKENVC